MNVILPGLYDAVHVSYPGCGSEAVQVRVTITEERLGPLCQHMREFAQDFDPQDFDAEFARARQALDQVQLVRDAIRHVARFYDAGDRGTALHEAVRYLRDIAAETDVL